MPHVQIEIDFLTHPKTLSISPLAQLLFIRSLIYSATHLTDGFIPEAAIPTISYDLTQYERLHYVEANVHASSPDVVTVDELINELVFRKRWKKKNGKLSGFMIHDYLDYQLSRAQVLQLIDKRRKAGQAGGQASASARAKQIVNDSATIFNPIPIPIPITKEEEKKEKSIARSRRLTDEEFLAKVKASPAYQHCDVDQESARMDVWLLANPGRAKTRKFMLNWLNKVEKPMAIQRIQPRKLAPVYVEPQFQPTLGKDEAESILARLMPSVKL